MCLRYNKFRFQFKLGENVQMEEVNVREVNKSKKVKIQI